METKPAGRAVELRVVVPFELAGQRLDQALAALFPDYSRSRLQAWIRAGRVQVDGRQLRQRDKLEGGEAVVVSAELEDETAAGAEAIALAVLHEDADILVLDKPAGLVVHPGAGNPAGTLLNALLHHRPELRALPRAGLVHRLDKDTSGVMVVACTPGAHAALVRQLEQHSVSREYHAVCVGVMTGGGTVDAPIARHPVDRVRMAIREGGREAVTHYRVAARFRGHTHVLCRLETGRTHQIRVHLASIRHPIVGDPVYGGRLAIPKGAGEALAEALRGFRRQALHAARLEFIHPRTGEIVRFEAPLPADLAGLLAALRADSGPQGDPLPIPPWEVRPQRGGGPGDDEDDDEDEAW
jgi:23S rRNA pseudouridine1911/1915/1917 synthase